MILARILGWLWIIFGVFFLINPEYLRSRLQKKSYKKTRRVLFYIAIFIGFLLIASAWDVQGFLAKLVLIFGIIAIFKAFLFLKGKAMETIFDWFLKQPIYFFRVWACVQILIGIILTKA